MKSQIISMDLVLGFVLFMIVISTFFYMLGGIPVLSQRKTLSVQADNIFTNLEHIPDPRIKFLDGGIVDELRIKTFEKIPYNSTDSDGDGLLDSREVSESLDSSDPDTDGDGYSDSGELAYGTNPNDYLSLPIDTDLDWMDDSWENARASEWSAVDSTFISSSDEAFHSDAGELGLVEEPGFYQGEMDYNCNGLIGDYVLVDWNQNGVRDTSEFTGVMPDGTTSNNCTMFMHTEFVDANTGCEPCMPNVYVYFHDKKYGDFDRDGLNDLNEFNLYGTDPWNNDTSGDGYPDGLNVKYGSSLTAVEVSTLWSQWKNTTGLSKLPIESRSKTADPDGDFMNNWDEFVYDTNPLMKDSDSDGTDDYEEIVSPTFLSVHEIVLNNINTFDFDKVDVCVFLKLDDGDVLHHIGPGVAGSYHPIKIGTSGVIDIFCGETTSGNPVPVTDADYDPDCMTMPNTQGIMVRKPVFYLTRTGEMEDASLNVLICARESQ